MATVAAFKKELENYFECSVCMNNFRDPKLLPCLHRYCRECIDNIIVTENKGSLTCPLCKRDCDIPEGGASGYKTDFHMKSLLEFIQLQKIFDDEVEKKCIFCSMTKKAEGYCFKCKDFLCDQCYPIHLSSNMFTDHQQHLLNLKKVEAKNLTLQKLASLTEDPRCHDHAKYMAQLCCVTCDNLPVCVTCVYGKHKGHDLHDVSMIAKTERESVTKQLDELDGCKDRLYELQHMVESAKHTLKANVAKKTETLISQHRHQIKKIERKIKENEVKFEQNRAEIDEDDEADCLRVEKEFDEKIRQINQERAVLLKETKEKHEERRRQNQEEHDEVLADLNRKFGELDLDLKNFEGIIRTQSTQNEEGIQEVGDVTDHTINRYENLKATTSTLLASNDDWTEAQCLPDIRAATGPLMEDMKKEYPELQSLNDVIVRDLPSVFDLKVTLTELEESVVDISGLEGDGWVLWSMTSIGDGSIVITGKASDEFSFITGMNKKGKVLRQDKINKEEGSKWVPWRHCDSLSQHKVVTSCESGQIGIYDIRNWTHTKKSISDVTGTWPTDRYVSCITTDPLTKNIFVGSISSESDGVSRDVLVYDDKLNYRHTLTLPDIIRGSRDITVHDGHLLVCDYDGDRAYAVTMEGREAMVIYELNKPDHDGGNWYPLRVCTDSHDYIYMLWGANISDEIRRVLTQHSQDGRQLLTTKPVHGNAEALCTCATDDGEKVMIAYQTSGKLYKFGLFSY